MARIFLLGNCPPNLLENTKIEAAHYRTWQLLDPLLADGHHVCLCTNQLPDNLRTNQPNRWDGRLSHNFIDFNQPGWINKLNSLCAGFTPDCIVAVNFEFCVYASRIDFNAPIWMDIYGDFLTIQQAYCYRKGSDRGVLSSIYFVNQVLKSGDVFSVCGTPQRHMLVGELAMTGRLSYRSFGYEFSRVILPGAARLDHPKPLEDVSANLKKKYGFSDRDFIILWCGGYNTWTDTDSLFNALEWAMTGNENIHFLSAGASTYDGAENVYSTFLRKIETSPFRHRYHMLGWKQWQEIPPLYAISSIGINIDAIHYETIYGTRTRLLEMIAAGLPVVTSLGSELSYILQRLGVALAFATGDWQEFGHQMLYLASNQPVLDEMQKKALEAARDEFSFSVTTSTLRKWVTDPKFAPDHGNRSIAGRIDQAEFLLRAYARQFIWKIAGLYR